jgi:hypothetical protein
MILFIGLLLGTLWPTTCEAAYRSGLQLLGAAPAATYSRAAPGLQMVGSFAACCGSRRKRPRLLRRQAG